MPLPQMNENEMMGQLAAMPGAGGAQGAQPPGPVGPTGPPDLAAAPGSEPTTQPPGGPGVDTPQEMKALELLGQAAVMFRQATEAEPSIRFIADKYLPLIFADITKHYGIEQEGKLAMQQAQLQKQRQGSPLAGGPPKPPVA
uniref:Uncharacterized protein n=2 Tax=viral metagenome TaxID=1070528 RepID=A0A6M3IMC9_9ZZZZ